MKKLLDSTEVEKIILGSILFNPESFIHVSDILQKNFFSGSRNRAIFNEIKEMDSSGKPIDKFLIVQKMVDQGKFAGIAKFINELEYSSQPGNIKYYTQVLLEKYIRRNLIERAQRIISDAADREEIDIFDLLIDAEAHIADIYGEVGETFSDERPLNERLEDIFIELESKIKSETISEGLRLKTLPTLNNYIGGIMPGDLIGIYGKEKSTKTTLAHEIALDIGIDQNIPVAIFSFEVSRKELEWKSISMRTGIDYFKLRNPKGYSAETKMSLEELEKLKGQTKDKFSNSSLFIFDKIMNEYQIYSKIKQLIKKYGVKLVVIDYLMLLESAKKFRDRRMELNHLSMFFKRTAMKLQVPIILISQSNQEGERAAEAKGLERDSNYFIYVQKGNKGSIVRFHDKYIGEYDYRLNEDEYVVTLRGIRHGKGNRSFITRFIDNRYVEVDTKRSITTNPQQYGNNNWYERKEEFAI